MIYADQRWISTHGIGRFARHVLAYIEYRPIVLESHPASALDTIRLSGALRNVTRDDLFFSPGYNAPLFCTAPVVFTVHDLNHIDRPENSSPFKRLYYATVLKRSCRSAAAILTVSDFSRRRIIEWSGVPPEKVVNVRCGVDDKYRLDVPPYKFPFPYLLCVSNRKGHKNEFKTVEAFARAKAIAGVRLVFTGTPTPRLVECINSHHIDERVHFVGAIPEAQLPSLYRSAEALIFASFYEGFGLPVLEAMACGTPVVTSNSSALPEVAGDAALLIDPASVEQIANAIERVMNDTSLRQQLRQKGLTQAARFSWNDTASKVREILRITIRA
jgi:glycosyltransferase involved in cell wall biosynthesis